MCGIVGYVGHGDTKEIILHGLKTLEYRGYDSSGMALMSDGEILVEKKAGRIENLEESMKEKNFSSEIGIGHTRWATHGVPSDRNSHPHYSMDKSVAVVHNGIIENYQVLRKELEEKGYIFSSDTDTEVISQLIQDMYNGNILDTVSKVVKKLEGSYAVGVLHNHTRWATHGVPSDRNSHPHYSMDKSVAVVHNGIIENYQVLRKELEEKGYIFSSDTDTEVISQLIQDMYNGNILDTVSKVVKKLEGSYAVGVLHKNHPDELICAREHSPLVIGIGEKENFIASDISALLKYTKDVYYLEDGDIAVLKARSIEIFDRDEKPVTREKKYIEWNLEQATKCGYPHFMLKEIFEQPQAVKETFEKRVHNGRVDFSDVLNYEDIKNINKIYIVACGTAYHAGLQGQFAETFEKRVHNGRVDFSDVLNYEDIKNINKIYIVACGTAYHAGLQGQFALQKIAKLDSIADIASEFRYNDPFIDEKTMVIFVSQSGETSDTLAALKEAKSKGALTIAVTNVVGSTISREAHKTIYTMAGPEIAVASTKAYTTQVTIFYLFALYMAELRKVISKEKYEEYLSEIKNMPEKIQDILDNCEEIKTAAEYFKDRTNGFFIGRGLDYKVAVEASLKIKEVSYVHTEAFASGELKHGTIALIEEGTPVVVIATQKNLIDKSVSNIKEVKARGAYIITVGSDDEENLKNVSDNFIGIPECNDMFSGFLSIVPLQLLAYYTSDAKGIDVDKPRKEYQNAMICFQDFYQ